MKHIAKGLLVAVLLVAITAPSAHAVSAYATWWKMSDDDAFGITVRHRQNITPLFALDGRVGWMNFSRGDVTTVPLELTALVKLGIFYGGPGLGYYFFSGDTALKDSFGYHLIGGVGLTLGPLGVYGEAKYGILKPDFDIPGGSEADLDHFGLHGGVVLGF